ncbi:MAG: amidohydrolase family protein [Chloroflexi bacterium]|nr:amidohydrolase family protein [Chloroflexota bacterium]
MIIDTETHVFYFARSSRTNPGSSRIKHYTWHEHDGDLLIAEMDNAGVDKAFLISYDAEDTTWSAEARGFSPEEFAGGKKHTLLWVRKYPDRFIWFNTVKTPHRYDSAALVANDLDEGAAGVKIFPAYIQSHLTDPGLMRVFEVCARRGAAALISFETLIPPKSLSLPEYLDELETVVAQFPEIRFALLHAGCVDPLLPEAGRVFDLTRRFDNLYLSTAMPGALWDDGVEYPYPNYQRRIETLKREVGMHKVMWATDWPWFDHYYRYEQAIQAVRRHATYLTEEEKASFLGGAAESFLRANLLTPRTL